jgi:hypothetical protein
MGSTLRGLEVSGDKLLRSAQAEVERETLHQQVASLEGGGQHGGIVLQEAEREPLRVSSEAMGEVHGMSAIDGELEKLLAAASGLEAEPRLCEALLALRSDRARLLGEVGGLQVEEGKLRKAVEALRIENDSLREAMRKLEMERCQPDNGGRQHDVGRANGQMGEFAAYVVAELDQLSGELRGALAELGPQLESLGGTVKGLEGERETLKAFGRKAKTEIVRLRKELQELQERAESASPVRPRLAATKVRTENRLARIRLSVFRKEQSATNEQNRLRLG